MIFKLLTFTVRIFSRVKSYYYEGLRKDKLINYFSIPEESNTFLMLRFADIPDANILWTLDFIATIFSLFGSITMIFSCFQTPSPKSLSLKFITTIGFANFLYSISNILSNFEENGQSSEFDLCSFEAILRQFSYTLLIFLSTCVAVATSSSIRSINQFNKKTLFFYSSVVIGLVISFLYFIIA